MTTIIFLVRMESELVRISSETGVDITVGMLWLGCCLACCINAFLFERFFIYTGALM